MATTKIQTDKDTAKVLNHFKQYGESYDDVIRRLIGQAGHDFDEVLEKIEKDGK